MRPVIGGRFQRIATWLCLALTLFTGVVPAQGIVLCLEADGCVSIEIKSGDGDCDGCVEHLDEPEVPGDLEGACPCVDLDVPGATEVPRLRNKACELSVDAFVTRPLPVPLAHVDIASVERRPFPDGRPRPAETLRLIRSVVLLR